MTVVCINTVDGTPDCMEENKGRVILITDQSPYPDQFIWLSFLCRLCLEACWRLHCYFLVMHGR